MTTARPHVNSIDIAPALQDLQRGIHGKIGSPVITTLSLHAPLLAYSRTAVGLKTAQQEAAGGRER